MFVITALAETQRAPFDLVEAEAELVAGHMLDYSSFSFALFFLAEYSSMLLMSTLITLLFLGGWGEENVLGFAIKNALLCFLWVHVRGTFPRYRYDQLLELG